MEDMYKKACIKNMGEGVSKIAKTRADAFYGQPHGVKLYLKEYL
jgi:hypothetical protein